MRDTTGIVPWVPPTEAITALERTAAPAGSSLPLPRLLLVLAHPDDEVLALGGRMERLLASQILHVTDGTPQDGADARNHGFPSLDAYRRARQKELLCALHHAGLPANLLTPVNGESPLPLPDQTAAWQLVALTKATATAISAFGPEAVLTHPYEGGHPDHDACAFAVHAALRLVQVPHRSETTVIETPFYHAGTSGSMLTGRFLPTWPSPAIRVCELSLREQEKKRARLACFASQAETLAQFGVERELFRLAPPYDFTVPPHPGRLFYEQFPWGVTGAQFRTLAAQALDQLGLSRNPHPIDPGPPTDLFPA